MNDLIKLHILNITITLRCNLRCKLCAADIHKYKEPPHFEQDELCNIMDRCFSIVDHTERFQLSGGEPFLHKELSSLIEYSLKFQKQYDQLSIFANGTILPSLDVLNMMKRHRDIIVVYLSNYGELSKKANDLKTLLDSEGIKCIEKVYAGDTQHLDGWVDYGDYEFANRSDEALETLFMNCGVSKAGGIWSCRFGEIHRCTRSCSGMNFGKVPRTVEDFIDLYDDLTVAEQKEKFHRLMDKKFITTCNYCTGDFGTENTSKRYPAAEQMQ